MDITEVPPTPTNLSTSTSPGNGLEPGAGTGGGLEVEEDLYAMPDKSPALPIKVGSILLSLLEDIGHKRKGYGDVPLVRVSFTSTMSHVYGRKNNLKLIKELIPRRTRFQEKKVENCDKILEFLSLLGSLFR